MKLIKNIKNKLQKKEKKWTLFIYFQGQLIKKKKVDDKFEPTKEFYLVNITGKKHLVGTNKKVTMLMQFSTYKGTNEIKKQLHIEVENVKGVA